MKEIHCSANNRFEPLKRIHNELDEQGIRGFLTYSEAPVCTFTPEGSTILTEWISTPETEVLECDVGRERPSEHRITCRPDGSRRG